MTDTIGRLFLKMQIQVGVTEIQFWRNPGPKFNNQEQTRYNRELRVCTAGDNLVWGPGFRLYNAG
jgi:hypothetical protein